VTQSPDAELTALLRSTRTIAVVGLSPDRTRASNGIARYLRRVGYRVIPVNPAHAEILGERSYARLEDIPEPVDLVDVFRRSEFVPDIAASAVARGAKGLWLQLEVSHEEAARLAVGAGLAVAQNRCIMIEHMRLLGAG
jgi:uncharacterized protein